MATQAPAAAAHDSASLVDETCQDKPGAAAQDGPLVAFLAPAQNAEELGRLGGFRILKILGHGGMGVVYLAEDPKLRRKVAIKAMLPHLAESSSSRQRFLREAQAAAALEHDHIVPILHVGEDLGVPYIVMPFLKGESLEERLKRSEPIPLDLIVQVGVQIADALAAAQAQKLLHRDIKPANIWLETRGQESGVRGQGTGVRGQGSGVGNQESGVRGGGQEKSGMADERDGEVRVKLLDFGLARLAQAEGTDHLTQTGAILGTPGYMSPEQAEGAALDGRSDLFSLGCVLYRMAAGRQAFEGISTLARLAAVARDTPAAPGRLNPTVPAPLSDLIMHLLEKKPEARPATAQEVARRLRAIDLPTALLPSPGARSTPVTHPSGAPKRRVPAIALGLAALCIVALAVFAILRITSPEGDYVIDTDDPDFAFSVSKDKVLLDDKKSKRQYHLKVVKQAKGEFELEVTDAGNDLAFHTKTFTIKRGQTVALKAWFERKQVAEVKTPPQVEPKKEPTTTDWKPIPVGQSPFDKLDPAAIPKEERFAGQPKELVGLIGSHRGNGGVEAGGGHPLVFSPDGRWLIGGVNCIWDAKTLILRYGHADLFGKPVFGADGKTMAMGGNNWVEFFDLSGAEPQRGQRRAVVPNGNGTHGVALIPGGKSVAAGLGSGHLGIYDLAEDDPKPRMLLRAGSAPSYNLMVTPDGKRLGAICLEPHETRPGEVSIRFWDISGTAPKELFEIPYKLKDGVLSATLSPDGKTLFVVQQFNKWLEAHDVAGDQPKLLDKADLGVPANALAGFVKDGKSFRVHLDGGGMQLWHIADGKLKKTRDLPPNTLAVSDDLSRIVTANPEHAGLSMILSDGDGKKLVEGEPPAVRSHLSEGLPFVAGGRVFTMTHPNRSWEVKNGGWHVSQTRKSRRFLDRCTLSPDEQQFTVLEHEGLGIYTPAGLFADKPALVARIPHDPAKNPISLFCWGTDSKTLFAAHADGALLAWDTTLTPPTSRLVWKGEGAPLLLIASNNGRHLAYMQMVKEQRQLFRLDLTGKTPPTPAPLPEKEPRFLGNVVFTPDGNHLVAEAGLGSLYRYPIETLANPTLVLTPPENSPGYFAFSRDGKYFVRTNGATLRWYDATVTPMRPLGEWQQFAFSRYFQIAPDSRHVLLEQAGTLYVLRLR